MSGGKPKVFPNSQSHKGAGYAKTGWKKRGTRREDKNKGRSSGGGAELKDGFLNRIIVNVIVEFYKYLKTLLEFQN